MCDSTPKFGKVYVCAEPTGTVIARVCFFCFPDKEIFKHYPELEQAGIKLGHGCCAHHTRTYTTFIKKTAAERRTA